MAANRDSYGHLRDWFTAYTPSAWRMNLTALSQYHNLYFVAFGTQIHVFEPLFPYQKLGDKPKLLLNPPMANPQARGFIDDRNRHSINHLVVGDLGNDEILLLCTDSGNVVAYRTKSIRAAIDKIDSDLQNASTFHMAWYVDDGHVTPFFSQAVERSAWGLAIHKTARMIAVSCNATSPPNDEDSMSAAYNAQVTIFAFSLVHPSSNERSSTSVDDDDNFDDVTQHQEWARKDGCTDAKARTTNMTLVHTHHESNVPSIAFINNGQDPYGEWILSTDIEGSVLMARIFDEKHEFIEYRFGKPRDGRGFGRDFDQRQMGWSVTALDPNRFHELVDPRSGLEEDGSDVARATAFNVGETALDDMTWMPSGSEDVLLDLGMDLSDDEDLDHGVSLMPHAELSTRAAGPSVLETENELEEGISSTAADRALERINAAESTEDPDIIDEGINEGIDEGIEDSASTDSVGESSTSSRDSYDSESLATYPQSESTNNRSPKSPSNNFKSQVEDKTDSHSAISTSLKSFPIMHTTNGQIRLITSPTNSCESVRQDHPFKHFYNPQSSLPFNRMNLTSYIPDLGVMVIGTQIGRVALLVLTRNKEGTLGFCLNNVLPTQRQFDSSITPRISAGGLVYQLPLLGIATSPLQGTELPPDASPSLSDEVWSDPGKDIFETTVVDGVLRTHESKLLVLPSSPQLEPRDRPKPQTLPKVVEDLKDQTRRRFKTATGLESGEGEKLNRKTSTRYRLMLYYFDHTVLSYEIGWS